MVVEAQVRTVSAVSRGPRPATRTHTFASRGKAGVRPTDDLDVKLGQAR